MKEKLHLPWDSNNTLKKLLHKIINIGETAKVDFKQELNIDTARNKAELLKDISAIANTHDPNYYNHGFILIGVKQNKIIGSSFLEGVKVDDLQARIDELVKNYLAPFIKTHVMIFDSNGKIWGVIIIPPTRVLPHVFIRDIDNKHRGDIYIRRGTTTERALPEDYARFFSVHLEEIKYEFRGQVDDLRSELDDIKRNLDTVAQTRRDLIPEVKSNIHQKDNEEKKKILQRKRHLNLLQEIDNIFSSEEDPIKNGLIKETRKIQSFLKSDTIPWALQIPSKEEGNKLFSTIEKESEMYWTALAKIVLNDNKNKYDEAIIQSLGYLARYYEAPAGTTYTDLGLNIRYYPLIVSLYIIFIVGAFKKRQSLLKQVASIELLRRSFYEESYPIAYSLFFIRRAGDVFQTQYERYPNSRWCDPVASYTKALLDRKLHIDDYLWDKDANFYVGEFLLSLLPLDVVDRDTGTPAIGHPSSGLFIYLSDSVPVIRRFLKNESAWVAKIFHRPFKDILKEFDQTAKNLVSGLCWADGFVSGAFETAFPEEAKNKLNKT